jgi:hypothetical protein
MTVTIPPIGMPINTAGVAVSLDGPEACQPNSPTGQLEGEGMEDGVANDVDRHGDAAAGVPAAAAGLLPRFDAVLPAVRGTECDRGGA